MEESNLERSMGRKNEEEIKEELEEEKDFID